MGGAGLESACPEALNVESAFNSVTPVVFGDVSTISPDCLPVAFAPLLKLTAFYGVGQGSANNESSLARIPIADHQCLQPWSGALPGATEAGYGSAKTLSHSSLSLRVHQVFRPFNESGHPG